MFQLQMSDQQSNSIIRCVLYWRLDGNFSFACWASINCSTVSFGMPPCSLFLDRLMLSWLDLYSTFSSCCNFCSSSFHWSPTMCPAVSYRLISCFLLQGLVLSISTELSSLLTSSSRSYFVPSRWSSIMLFAMSYWLTSCSRLLDGSVLCSTEFSSLLAPISSSLCWSSIKSFNEKNYTDII